MITTNVKEQFETSAFITSEIKLVVMNYDDGVWEFVIPYGQVADSRLKNWFPDLEVADSEKPVRADLSYIDNPYLVEVDASEEVEKVAYLRLKSTDFEPRLLDEGMDSHVYISL